MVKHQIPNRDGLGSIFTGGIMLRPKARHINPKQYQFKAQAVVGIQMTA